MARVPAICPDCKTVVPSKINIRSKNDVIEGCTAGPCPKCGATVVILDGVYSAVDDALQVLVGSQSIDLLRQLRDILQEAKKENLEPAKVRDKIREASPELKSIADCVPKTRSDLYAFLSLLILLLTSLIQSGKNNYSMQEVNNYFETTINNVYQLPEKDKSAVFTTGDADSLPTIEDVSGEKPGRNDPCPCGSGKKFKKCCGKNRS